MKRGLYILVFLIALQMSVTAQECLECHLGQDKEASVVLMEQGSVHEDLECSECHGDLEIPHLKDFPPVLCGMCHEDEATAFQGSSHGKKHKEWLGSKGFNSPSTPCLGCHGKPHQIEESDKPSSSINRGNISSTCLECHKDFQPIAVDKYLESVHAAAVTKGKQEAAVCTDCHGSHSIDHSGLANSKAHYNNVPETCRQCHPNEFEEYALSIHWSAVKEGFREAPVCTDCHGEHGIRSPNDPESQTWTGNVTKTCSSCHASERITSKFLIPSDRVESFMDSFHGLSNKLGDLRVANCASCHGNHRILPSSDSRSSIHPSNLGKTCGRCHPGVEKGVISGPIHTTLQRQSHWIVGAVREIYIVLIVVTIVGMLLHNFLDLVTKARRFKVYEKYETLFPRFSVHERIQHALLAFCFLTLAVSGFALEYPNSPFAWPFQWLSAGADIRRWMHRIAALLFLGLGFYHACYLTITSRGRRQLKEMMPRFQDLSDAKGVIFGCFKKSSTPIMLPHYSYVEKTEYWALVWGSIIMTGTGFLLYFVNLTLSNLPLWVIDLAVTIHFWEALLATLAIAIWHGYWVIYDPEIYPMNMTWLIGNPRAPKRGPDESQQTEGEKP